MEEIFKDIPGYEGVYQVSNLGNVKNLSRTINSSYNKTRTIKERILRKGISTTGYYIVVLSKENVVKTRKVHQLVAMAFLGHKPDGFKLVVNHINFNKLDNRVENLEIVTHRENCNQKHLKDKCASKYTGVNWLKKQNRWRAVIDINGKSKYLGVYIDEYHAHLAYEKALKELNK